MGESSIAPGQNITDADPAYLRHLLEACNRVLPHVEGRDDELANVLRETCRIVEARLRELEPRGA
jgi:hypothetical protein